MRKALVVGIDFYKSLSQLHGCVNDAHSVKSVIERHGDGSINFNVRLLTSSSASDAISRKEIKDSVKELFEGDSEIALFYFAGHGYIEITGGYLCSSDSESGDDGLSLGDVMIFANSSKVRNKIVVLDSCHSGIAGAVAAMPQFSELAEGVTILTASTAEQYSEENNACGVFTSLFVDALSGAASNLVGDITPGSVYAHIDQSLGPWQQRPVFKTNVKSFVSLREVNTPISNSELRLISRCFPGPGHEFHLDPSYEPEGPCPDADRTRVFAILQKFNRVNLVVPVGAPHMYHAAMESKTCRLTALGEHYRRLVERGLI
jgi:hypothetical protein